MSPASESEFTNQITVRYDGGWFGYFNASPQSTPLQGPFQVSIAGRQYAVDLSFKPYRRDAFRHRSLPNVRESLNIDNVHGRGVIDPSGLWRRDQIDWSYGAGQLYLDHQKSADNRFYKSKGVDPMTTQWQVTLLNDTVQGFTLKGGGTFIKPLVVGQYRYYMEQDAICYEDVASPGTYHTLTGGPATGAGHYFSDITANGSFVFVACGTNGIYYWPINSTTGAVHYVTQTGATSSGDVGYTFTGVSWAADYLWATGEQHVYVFGASTNTPLTTAQVTGGVLVSAVVPPHSNGPVNANETLPDVTGAGWHWTNMVGGNSQVYLGGYYQSGSIRYGGGVYRIGQQITTNPTNGLTTTTFLAPTRALQLTPGEYPTAVFSYLNYIFVGSSLGVRMCRTLSLYDPTAAATGDLEGGAEIPNVLQPVSAPVTSFTAQGRWVYFAWPNYDGTSTGIGRMDVQTFIDDLTPAYVSHLMVTGQCTQLFLEWDSINQAPMIALSSPTSGIAGVYVQSASLVPSGTLNTGWLTYDVPDDKVLIKGTFALGQAFGGLKMFIATDDSTGSISPMTEAHAETALANDLGRVWFLEPFLRGNKFQFQVELDRDTIQLTEGPTLSSWTMWGQPIYVASETTISVVLILFNRVQVEGAEWPFEPYAEYHFLDTLRRNQTIVEYVEGPFSAQTTIMSLDWLPENPMGRYKRGYQADLVVYLQTINGFTYTPEPLT